MAKKLTAIQRSFLSDVESNDGQLAPFHKCYPHRDYLFGKPAHILSKNTLTSLEIRGLVEVTGLGNTFDWNDDWGRTTLFVTLTDAGRAALAAESEAS